MTFRTLHTTKLVPNRWLPSSAAPPCPSQRRPKPTRPNPTPHKPHRPSGSAADEAAPFNSSQMCRWRGVGGGGVQHSGCDFSPLKGWLSTRCHQVRLIWLFHLMTCRSGKETLSTLIPQQHPEVRLVEPALKKKEKKKFNLLLCVEVHSNKQEP